MMGWLVAAVLLVVLLIACRKIEVTQAETREEMAKHEKCHAETLALLGSLNRQRDGASALRKAAEQWEDPLNRPHLEALARSSYTPGGPSMPAIFLRLMADQIETPELDLNEYTFSVRGNS